MKKRIGLGVSCALAATLLTAGNAAAQVTPTVYIWDAAGIGQATPSAWGNGEARTARERGGASVLNVTTRNFHEGARFDFKTPVSLEPYREEGYLRLRVRLAGTRAGGGRMPMGGAMPGMAPGMPGMSPGAMMPPTGSMPGMPNMMPGGGDGTGMMGGAGGFGAPAMPGMTMPGTGTMPEQMGGMNRRGRTQTPSLNQMQVVVLLERGAMFGQIEIDQRARPAADGFQIVMLRLQDMRSTPDASGGVRRIVLTGDREASFAMSQAAFVVESENIAVSIRREEDPMGTQTGEITVRPGIPFNLVADVEAGISDVDVSWNYDADNAGLPLPNSGRGNRGGMAMPNIPGAVMPGMPGVMTPNMPGAGMPMGAPGTMPGMGGMTMPGMPATGMPGMGGAMGAASRVDAMGLAAQMNFPNEEQDYRVEVTVRDRSGRKEDARASILVRVRSAGA